MKLVKMSVKITIVTTMLLVLGCGKQTPPQANQEQPKAATGETGDESPAAEETADAITLTGAGATFPFPIYSKWAHGYKKVKGTKLNYQSIGSGGGIAQIKAKTVAFGASDAPLKSEELDEVGLIQFPMIMGGVVPVVNLEGIAPGQLKLSQGVLADVFLGKIKKWNDKAIASDNPGVKLPATNISVVHRADGSGTTWIFTNYLDKISEEWHSKVGTGKSVEWPTGVGGKGNEGVAAYVQRIKGAVGYVEFAYALQNQMSHVKLQNRDGNYVDPTIESFQAAAANADWKNAPGFYLVLTDQPGTDSWPITGASFILMYKQQDDATIAREALNFFDWCYENGAQAATDLHYVPMPKEVVELVHAQWKENIRSGGDAIWQ